MFMVQMQQGRRTASLKASYEAAKNVELTKELALGRHEYGAGTPRSVPASSVSDSVTVTKSSSSRNRKFVLCAVAM